MTFPKVELMETLLRPGFVINLLLMTFPKVELMETFYLLSKGRRGVKTYDFPKSRINGNLVLREYAPQWTYL